MLMNLYQTAEQIGDHREQWRRTIAEMILFDKGFLRTRKTASRRTTKRIMIKKKHTHFRNKRDFANLSRIRFYFRICLRSDRCSFVEVFFRIVWIEIHHLCRIWFSHVRFFFFPLFFPGIIFWLYFQPVFCPSYFCKIAVWEHSFVFVLCNPWTTDERIKNYFA